MKKLIIVIPIYKATLDVWETFSLRRSVDTLPGRELVFIGPEGLDLSLYQQEYPQIPFIGFDPELFASIPGYNRLLLGKPLHERFADYEFMLILQTDAIILRDELDWWCEQPFDYVGAPWPQQYELMVELDRFVGDNRKHMKVSVGNGGLSLRRIAKCVALFDEFPDATRVFRHTGSSEDLFYSVMGVNGGHLPMGAHAWWKYEPEFWRQHIPGMPG
jgi:hypothetical protein